MSEKYKNVLNKKILWAGVFFLVLPFLFYHDTAAMKGILGSLDALFYQFPHRVYLWQQGNFSLWNPYRLCGFSELASMQASVLYPLNAFFFSLFPPIVAFNLNVLFHFSLAGLFTCLYMRVLNFNWIPALFSGMAYMFCGFLVNYSDTTNLQNMAVWLPLMLLFMEKIQQTRKLVYVACAALVVALIIFIGHPPTAASIGLIVFYYMIYLVLTVESGRVSLVLYGGLVFVLGILLGMAQLLPTLELLDFTIRESIQPDMVEVSLQSYSLEYLITFLFPLFFGCLTDSFYPVSYYLKEFIYKGITYAGILPILFVVAAWVLRKKNDPKIIFWTIVIGFSFLLAMGNNTPLFLLTYRLPVFNLFYNTSAHMLELNFAFAVLSGIGLQYVMADKKYFRKKTAGVILGLLLLIAAIVAASLFMLVFTGESASHYKANVARTLTVSNPAIYIPILMLLLSGGIFWFIYCQPKKKIGYVFLLVVLFMDLYSFGHFIQNNSFRLDEAGFGGKEPSVVRFLREAENNPNSFRIFPVARYLATIKSFDFPVSDMNIIYPLSSITTIDSLYYEDHARLFKAKRNGMFKDPVALVRNNNILSMLNVKYLISIPEFKNTIDSEPVYKKVFTSESGICIFENRNVLPRAYMVEELRAVKDFDEALELLWNANGQFDPRRQALVELPGDIDFGQITKGKTEFVSYKNDEVIIKTESSGKSFLVLGDTFYPDWKAYVDGQETEIFKTNGITRGVFVSPGSHIVSFSYQPFSIISGAFISGLALIVLIIILVLSRYTIYWKK